MKKRIENATIIGTGSVATHLAIALHRAGVSIDFIIGRSEEKAAEIAIQVNAQYSSNLSMEIRADLLILAITDDGYPTVVPELKLSPETLVVHTSGSVSIDILSKLDNPHGVFYPLQTFTKGREIDYSNIPICIEASTADMLNQLESIGRLLSSNVTAINSQQRLQLHIAAVFCCNFVNHLYSCSEEILTHCGLPFPMLHPLIVETAHKAIECTPAHSQTGPAKRGDLKVIEKHLHSLDSMPLKEIYTSITTQILKKFNP